jgi:hypothetical protein
MLQPYIAMKRKNQLLSLLGPGWVRPGKVVKIKALLVVLQFGSPDLDRRTHFDIRPSQTGLADHKQRRKREGVICTSN